MSGCTKAEPRAAWGRSCTCEPCTTLREQHYEGMSAQWAMSRQLGDLDDVLVERILSGDGPRDTAPERLAAVAELTRLGMSAADIGERVKRSERQVHRDRATARRAGLEAGGR